MISVVIPVFNREKYIKDCVDSALKQTYKDKEVVVVDDGSTDDTKTILSRFGPKIKYIYKKNGGAASARNEGIKNIKGDLIAWLDSDDIWLDFKLELESEILRKLPEVGFVHSDFACFTDEDGLIAKSYIRDYFFILKACKLDICDLLHNKATLKDLGIKINNVPDETLVYWGDVSGKAFMGPMFLPSSLLLRKECITKVGFFNEKYKTAEDFDLLARIAKLFPVAYVDFSTLLYRRFHADQLSGDAMELQTNIVWLEVAKKLGVDDTEFYNKNKKFVDSHLAHCYYGIGEAYLKKSMPEKALDNLITSIKRNPQQKRIYLLSCYALYLILRKRFLALIKDVING